MTEGGTPDQRAVTTVRVALPHQLRVLAGIHGPAEVQVAGNVTLGATLDALEAAYPPLAGTIRDRETRRRRAMIRLFADGADLSDADASTPLPGVVTSGQQPLRLVGAIAGGA